jgi:uncharacterized membrane protein YebE (DUF533 family)
MEPKVILYIVVGIGYFIYNIYKKVKAPQVENTKSKHAEEPVNYSEDSSQGDQGGYKTIDDIISDLNSHGHVKSKEKQKASTEVQERGQPSANIAREIEREYEDVKSQRKSMSSQVNTAKKSKPSKRVVSKKKKVKFDLRKAVLYRSVLERPKF